MKSEWKFPQFLSQPFQILWFELDDLLFFLLSIVVGQAFGGVFWLLVIIVPYLSTKLKRNFARGFGKHLLYFLGLVDLKGYPGAFVQEFVE